MCMGLSQNSIHVIVESEDSDALLYLCTACRLKPGSGAWTRTKQKRATNVEEGQNELIIQLFQTVKGLCMEVAGLSQKINSMLTPGELPETSKNHATNKSYSEALTATQSNCQHQQNSNTHVSVRAGMGHSSTLRTNSTLNTDL